MDNSGRVYSLSPNTRERSVTGTLPFLLSSPFFSFSLLPTQAPPGPEQQQQPVLVTSQRVRWRHRSCTPGSRQLPVTVLSEQPHWRAAKAGPVSRRGYSQVPRLGNRRVCERLLLMGCWVWSAHSRCSCHHESPSDVLIPKKPQQLYKIFPVAEHRQHC